MMITGKAAGKQTIIDNMLELVGNTPLVRLHRLPESGSAEILAKLESFNPGWSVKDRIAVAMVESGEECGLLKPGGTIVEPTSGNTGIGLALVAAVKGYRCVLTMPESMSLERRFALESLGAEIVLTPATEGMRVAVEQAKKIAEETGAYMPQQFDNPSNPEIHRTTTAREILEATEGKLDAFVSGIGTGGTITGVGEVLRKELPDTQIIAVEPSASPLLSEGKAAPHKIQGIGANFVPSVLDRSVIDRIITVTDDDAFRTARKLGQKEGMFVGISAGAAMFAALQVAKELGEGKRVVVVLPDLGDRYASMAEKFRV